MGEIVELRAGAARARLLPQAGGRVSMLELERPDGGTSAVLHPYPEEAVFDPLRWGKGGIYPLMPYSNRIENARLELDGGPVALAPHPDAAPHTLHGNAHAQPWQLGEAGDDHAEMLLDSPASAAWPWCYRARMALQLTPGALTVDLSLHNTDTRPMPAGLGLHPYFLHRVDAPVALQARTLWPATPDFLAAPARALAPDEGQWPARPLRPGGMTDYLGGWDGLAELGLPDGAVLQMTADPLLVHLVVHRPDNLAYLCLEPVSHVANGFNLAARGVPGTGARMLAPGGSLQARVRFALLPPRP